MNVVKFLSDKGVAKKIHLPKAVLPHFIVGTLCFLASGSKGRQQRLVLFHGGLPDDPGGGELLCSGLSGSRFGGKIVYHCQSIELLIILNS